MQPLSEGQEQADPTQTKRLPLCGHSHEDRPCGRYICAFDAPSANPRLTSKAMYWEVGNKRGHRGGYIKWVAKSSVKRWTKPKGHHLSTCTVMGLGADGMGVYSGGAGIVGSVAGPEVSGPLFLMAGASELVGLGFDFAHNFTGC